MAVNPLRDILSSAVGVVSGVRNMVATLATSIGGNIDSMVMNVANAAPAIPDPPAPPAPPALPNSTGAAMAFPSFPPLPQFPGTVARTSAIVTAPVAPQGQLQVGVPQRTLDIIRM